MDEKGFHYSFLQKKFSYLAAQSLFVYCIVEVFLYFCIWRRDMLFISLGHSEWILSLYNAPQTWFFVSEMELNTSQHACNSALAHFQTTNAYLSLHTNVQSELPRPISRNSNVAIATFY